MTNALKVSEETGRKALAILTAIVKMSDEAEKLGGATSIAGVASLHKMQTSIQRNAKRIGEALLQDQKEINS